MFGCDKGIATSPHALQLTEEHKSLAEWQWQLQPHLYKSTRRCLPHTTWCPSFQVNCNFLPNTHSLPPGLEPPSDEARAAQLQGSSRSSFPSETSHLCRILPLGNSFFTRKLHALKPLNTHEHFPHSPSHRTIHSGMSVALPSALNFVGLVLY